jgi:hypothetical protein
MVSKRATIETTAKLGVKSLSIEIFLHNDIINLLLNRIEKHRANGTLLKSVQSPAYITRNLVDAYNRFFPKISRIHFAMPIILHFRLKTCGPEKRL